MATYILVDSVEDAAAVGGTMWIVNEEGKAVPMTVLAIDANVVFLSEPIDPADVPQSESVWATERPELQHQLFRVIGIKESGPAQYEFTAIKHEPGKEAYVEEGIIIQPKITTALIPDILPAPTNLRIGAYSRAGVQNSSNVIAAQWDESPNAHYYELQWRKDAGVYSAVQKVFGTVCEYDNAFPGVYDFKIVAVNKSKTSPPAFSEELTVGIDAPSPLSETLQIISSASGTLTIDCAVYKNFKTTLTENTTVEFTNVPQSKEITLQVTNGGSFALTFPAGAAVGAYTGPVTGATDLLALKTVNYGTNWSFNQSVLSAGGSFAVLIDPDFVSLVGDGTPMTLAATVIGGTGPFTYAWTRVGTAGGTNFSFSATNVEDPDVSKNFAGATPAEQVQTWKLTVTDSAMATAEATCTIHAYNPNYIEDDPLCVAADSFMYLGNRAYEVRAGTAVAVWDRNIENPGVMLANVVNNMLGRQPVYKLVTESGKSCRVSANTPIELRDGRVVMATEMLNEDIVVCDVQTDSCAWERITIVQYLGIGSVAKISAGDTVLLAGDDPRYMLGTHNIRYKP